MDDRTATAYKSLRGHTGMVCATSFNPDKSFMLTSSVDGSSKLYQGNTDISTCFCGKNVTCHVSASSLLMVAADAAFFISLCHLSLSSQVLPISMFVISVHLLKLSM